MKWAMSFFVSIAVIAVTSCAQMPAQNAAAQKQPTTILVTALAQDLPYINQAIWKGVPTRHAVRLNLENLTAGALQPYSVSIKPTQGG